MAKISSYSDDTVFSDTDTLIGYDSATGETKQFTGAVVKAGMATTADITQAENRANHTGTQSAATISDLDAHVSALIASAQGSGVAGKVVTQPNHGFAVGTPVRFTGANWVASKADTGANSEVYGMISAVPGPDTFILSSGGYISGLSGLVAGSTYFLDPSTAGALTLTEPTSDGSISKPLLMADSQSSGFFCNFRGITNVGVSSTTGGGTSTSTGGATTTGGGGNTGGGSTTGTTGGRAGGLLLALTQ